MIASLVAVGHDAAHDSPTRHRGKDDVWVPLSPEEYAALPPISRGLCRFYRSAYGPLLDDLIGFW